MEKRMTVKTFLLLVSIVVLAITAPAQSLVLTSPQKKAVKRGFIYYPDGRNERYTQLFFRDDAVEFLNPHNQLTRQELRDIESISQLRTNAGKGAAIGATAGFLAGTITSLIFFSHWGDEEGTVYDSEEGWKVDINSTGWIVIGSSTAGLALLGTLAGLGSTSEKNIYQSNPNIDVFPGLSDSGTGRAVPALYVAISF